MFSQGDTAEEEDYFTIMEIEIFITQVTDAKTKLSLVIAL